MKKTIKKTLCAGLLFIATLTSITLKANTFTLLTYNVAGLFQYVSGSDPLKNTPIISTKINEYDICLFQEDFNYHQLLINDSIHPFKSSHQSIWNWGMGYGDGLSRVSKIPFSTYLSEAWNNCSGYIYNSNDCLTPKGFSFARHFFADNVIIDIYNLHTDAGASNEDLSARSKNFTQLIKRINTWSTGHAVIVAGDTNSRFKQKNGAIQLINQGFSDAWVSTYNNEIVPKNNSMISSDLKESEKVDKILYRSTKAVNIKLESFNNLNKTFVDAHLKPLSDHAPWMAKFSYNAGDKFNLTAAIGCNQSKLFFNDLPEIPTEPTIKTLTLEGSNTINYIKTEYSNGATLEHGNLANNNSKNSKSFKLENDEYFEDVIICSQSNYEVGYISITTNLGNNITVGTHSDNCSVFKAPEEGKFVGFWGQESLKNKNRTISQLGLISYK